MMDNVVVTSHNMLLPEAASTPEVASNSDTQFSKTDFETRSVLGKKGTRNMDKLTGLAIHCIADIVPTLKDQLEQEGDRVGIVVGSAQGSMDSIVRFTYDTLAHERADYVNPALFPNTVMNCPAGQSAIRYGLKGPNATISSGELSSLASINYAISLLENKYADTLIAGGIEELTEVNIAANTKLAEKMGAQTKFTESSAFFSIESEEVAKKFNRKVLAEISGISLGFNPTSNQPRPLCKLVEKVLDSANVNIADIEIFSLAATWPETKEIEYSAISHLLGDQLDNDKKIISAFTKHGNAVSSHNALQLCSLVDQLSPNSYGLLLAQDLKGNMGVMLVKGGAQ